MYIPKSGIDIAAPSYVLTIHAQSFKFLHIHVNNCYLLCVCFFNNNYPNWCEVVSHCDFDLCFLKTCDVEHLSCAYQPFVFFCGKMSIQVLLSILNCIFVVECNITLLLTFWNVLNPVSEYICMSM